MGFIIILFFTLFPFPLFWGDVYLSFSVPSAGRVAWFREKNLFLGQVEFPLYKGPSAGVDIAPPL